MKEKETVSVAIVLVYNSKNEFLIHLRAPDDVIYPSTWDFSAGGKINKGEEPKIGAQRELKEELGIEAELDFVGDEIFEDENDYVKLFIYKTVYDGFFTPDLKEVKEIRILNRDSLEKMMENENFHPQFRFLWQKGIIFRK